MILSQDAVQTLVDLIENKLSVLQIGDRDDVREMVVLRRCLSELRGLDGLDTESFSDIPRRGRRRKVSDLMDDQEKERA